MKQKKTVGTVSSSSNICLHFHVKTLNRAESIKQSATVDTLLGNVDENIRGIRDITTFRGIEWMSVYVGHVMNHLIFHVLLMQECQLSVRHIEQ